mmetsp:Transcript_21852/g.39838  ORF Transcript_21852/g.39838 Transcript_21852/m.39838 type:complete len:413 (-) Transcript_21852:1363-2601(-)
MANYVTQMKDTLGLRQRASGSRNGSRSPSAKSPLLYSTRHSDSTTPTGKKILKQSVMESYKKLMQSRAGMNVIGTELRENSSSPSPYKSFDTDISSLSHLAEEGVLPQYNLLTGKVERLERLPTYDEYLGSEVFSLPHASTRKALDKVKETARKIETYYNSMRRLAKHVQVYGYLPETLEARRFERQATKHSKVSTKEDSLKLDRQFTRISKLSKPETEYSKGQTLSHHKYSVDSGLRQRPKDNSLDPPESILLSRRKSFRRARHAQDQNLSSILTRIDRDRATVMREKVKIVHMNSQAYKDSLHTLSLFNDIRRVLERERVDRRDKAVEQMKGYLRMCEFFRFVGRKPYQKELRLLEAVKLRLEEGLAISAEDFDEILNFVDCHESDEAYTETLHEFRKNLGILPAKSKAL